MLSQLFIALVLMAVSVVVHASGLSVAVRWLHHRMAARTFWARTWVFIRLAGRITLLHLAEIAVWAAFYERTNAMPDLASALYFSAVTYTTTGYGDLLLPESWRLVGGVEALTGILMCGWSTGFFFAVVGRMLDDEQRRERMS